MATCLLRDSGVELSPLPTDENEPQAEEEHENQRQFPMATAHCPEAFSPLQPEQPWGEDETMKQAESSARGLMQLREPEVTRNTGRQPSCLWV